MPAVGACGNVRRYRTAIPRVVAWRSPLPCLVPPAPSRLTALATRWALGLAGLLTLTAASGAARAEPLVPIPVDPSRTASGWGELVRLLTDRDTLASKVPPGTFAGIPSPRVFIGRVEAGFGGQPRLYYFSHKNTGFETNDAHFHPASTVKLAASIAALLRLGQFGFSGAAHARLPGRDGLYEGPVRHLVAEAIGHSSNSCYNHLLEIAGMDALNEHLLAPRWGLPTYEIRARYGGSYRGRVTDTPAVTLREGPRTAAIPGTTPSSRPTSGCPGNCTNLAELHEIQRRFFLHDALPPSERFALHPEDRALIRETMRTTRKRLRSAPRSLLGEGVQVFNNVGRIPGTSVQEIAYMESADGRDRLFAAVAVGFPPELGDDNVRTVRWMDSLCLAAGKVARAAPLEGPGLQHPWGAPVSLALWQAGRATGQPKTPPGGAGEVMRAHIHVPGARSLRVWVNRRALFDGPVAGALAGLTFTAPPVATGGAAVAGLFALTVEARGEDGGPLAYRPFLVELPPDRGASGPGGTRPSGARAAPPPSPGG